MDEPKASALLYREHYFTRIATSSTRQVCHKFISGHTVTFGHVNVLKLTGGLFTHLYSSLVACSDCFIC